MFNFLNKGVKPISDIQNVLYRGGMIMNITIDINENDLSCI